MDWYIQIYGSRYTEEGIYPNLSQKLTMHKVASFVQPFVLYGNGGAGKSALLSKSALQSLKVEEMLKSLSLAIYILSSQLTFVE